MNCKADRTRTSSKKTTYGWFLPLGILLIRGAAALALAGPVCHRAGWRKQLGPKLLTPGTAATPCC